MSDAPLLGPICAFLSSCTWAVGSANFSLLSRDHRPPDVNLTRALFALPCFVVAVLVTQGGLHETLAAFRALESGHYGWFTLSMFASYAFGDCIFLLSTLSLGVPGALAIASGYPILTATAGVLFEGQTLGESQWAGLVLAVSGIVAVILHSPKATRAGADSAENGVVIEPSDAPSTGAPTLPFHPFLRRKSVGVALAILTMFAWATNGYSVMKGGADVDTAVANTMRMLIALVLVPLVSFAFFRKFARPLPVPILRRFSWLFILEGFGGSYFYVYGLSHSPLVLGSTLASLAPVLAVPVAVAMKLERFSWVRSAAVLTVVVGLSLLFS